MAFSDTFSYFIKFQSEFNPSLLQNLRYPVTMPTSSITMKEKQSQNQLPI